ncbi:MAG TPA: hypothetical protein VGD67_28415, partial [Pseudonocardiaceae bacterium]
RAARRAAATAAVSQWCTRHRLHLLFVPVIVVPAVLAWPAMAVYGAQLWGPLGVLLPAFSEGTMWVFALAIAVAVREGRPVAWLRVGLWASCAMAGVLNFLHGLHDSLATGVVMAVVSVAGVVVHQLIAARPPRPRRTRAERESARLARLAERRVMAVRRAAVRQAVAVLAEDGSATLAYRAGTITLRRRLAGRGRLAPVIVPGLPAAPAADGAHGGAHGGGAVGDDLAAEITAWLAGDHPTVAPDDPGGNGGNTPGTAATLVPGVAPEIAARVPALLARVRRAIADGRLSPQPSRRDVQRFLRVRAEVAVAVAHALNHNNPGNHDSDRDGDDGLSGQAVTA